MSTAACPARLERMRVLGASEVDEEDYLPATEKDRRSLPTR